MLLVPLSDPDRDEARRILQEELDSGVYQVEPSLTSRFLDWLSGLIPQIGPPQALPSWAPWVLLGVVLVAVLAVLAFAWRGRWRQHRLQEDASASVLGDARRDAAEHRRRARAALEDDPGLAVLEAYRALTVRAIDRTLLDDRPCTTAHEVAHLLGPVFATHAAQLREAADLFDRVRYGRRAVTRDEARSVLELEDRLSDAPADLDAVGTARQEAFR